MALKILVDNQELKNFTSFEYSINMNEINRSVINLESNTSLQNSLLSLGSKITILKDNDIDFVGKINSRNNHEGNAIKLICRGEEEEYIKDNIDLSALSNNGVYINTGSADIFEELIGNGGVTYSSGTIETGINIDQRVSDSSSWWNGILNLIAKTGQEKHIDYTAKEVSIYDSLGTDNVDTLNEGADFRDLVFVESEPAAKKIIVYGKGDGINQYKAIATDGGFVKGSDNVKTIRDPTIISDAECQIRADNELAKSKENIETYQIPILKPYGKNYVVGDTITLNGKSYGLVNKSVRIVRVIRGMTGDSEWLRIEVTNANHSKTFKNSIQKINEATLKSQDKETYEQGSGNTLTFGGQKNAKNGSPLTVYFNLPDEFIKDEAGNIRVNSFTFDYDVDPYRRTSGDASGSGNDALVNGLSGDSQQDTELDAFDTSVFGGGDNDTVLGLGSVTGDTDFTTFTAYIARNRSNVTVNEGVFDVWIRNLDTGTTYVLESDILETGPMWVRTFNITGDIELDDIEMNVFDNQIGGAVGLDYSYGLSASQIAEHDHDKGSYNTLDTEVANAIEIGDEFSDLSSVDSTSIGWVLQYFNGSTWVTKDSGNEAFPVGQTLDTDIDLSNGGTLPDLSGSWKLILTPNTTSGDFVKCNINVKHNLEN